MLKNCKKCGKEKELSEYPPQLINKDKHSKTCIDCTNERKNEKAGAKARSMLKTLKKQQNKRKTPQQLRRTEEEKKYQKVRKKILDRQIKDHGFMYCEICGFSTTDKQAIHCHHIIHRSQCFDIEKLHSKENIIPLCFSCHSMIHREKHMNDKLIKERKLDK